VGTPACRITDQTAHGGVIVTGFPTVLIGMLPAARIGDNHVCPMVMPGVPPVPHVGGPFVMGSPTVLVGNMPQSRVNDQLICVGPPDTAVMGEPTVLVGMVGAGGLAGAMAGLQAMGVAVPMNAASLNAGGMGNPATATFLADGTLLVSAPPGGALPPIPLSQTGWPDLPPETTATFESVQPVTLQPGTTLYGPADEKAGGGSLWSVEPPEPAADASSSASGSTTSVVEGGDGVRAWMGQPAGDPAGARKQGASPQVWIAPQTASSGALRRVPHRGTGR
jgi:uncharacterized Zn-binding protein involved in type VI secretion